MPALSGLRSTLVPFIFTDRVVEPLGLVAGFFFFRDAGFREILRVFATATLL
jgi:hypothetical protein